MGGLQLVEVNLVVAVLFLLKEDPDEEKQDNAPIKLCRLLLRISCIARNDVVGTDTDKA